MKISEMSTTQLSAFLCRVAAPLERIGMDENVGECLRHVAEQAGKAINPIQQFSVMLGTFVPLLLERHEADTMDILAAASGKTVDEIRAQKGMQTIAELRELLSDQDMMDFFTSSASTGKSV